MGQGGKRNGEKEVAQMIAKLKNTGRYSQEVLEIVKNDLQYGLSKTEIDVYLGQKLEAGQMRLLSEALKKYGMEVAKAFAREGLDERRMQVALDYYEKGIPLERILENAIGTESAHELQLLYAKMLKEIRQAEQDEYLLNDMADRAYMEQVLGEMKNIVLAIQHDSKRYEALSEKLKEMESAKNQEAALAEKEAVIERLEEELERLKKEKAELLQQIKEQEEKSTMQEKEIQPIPVQYVAAFPGANGQPMFTAIVERSQPKNKGLITLLGKLAYKKKSKQDIVKMIATGELDKKQLVQLKSAMAKGLTEEQLHDLIHGNVSAEQMEEIIEIAVLENQMRARDSDV